MKQRIPFMLLGLLAFASPALGEQSGGLDWTAWQRMPVLQDGRIMPMDSFARTQVRQICGDVAPSLGKIGSKTVAEMRSLSAEEIHRLAVDGRPRKFLAAELIYAWTVEPENWDDVPFLLAEDAALRSEVLGVPLTGEDGSRLKYVSPRQVRLSQKFAKVLGDIEKVLDEAQQKKRKPVLSPLQDSARRLDEALELFLQLGYDPNRAGKANPWVASDFAGMQKSWVRCAQALAQHPPLTVQAVNLRVPEDNQQSAQQLRRKLDGCLRAAMLEREFYQLADKTDTAMQDFITQWGPVENGRKPVSSVESAAAKVRRLTADLDAKMRELAGQDLPDPALLVEDNREDVRGYRQIFSRWTRDLALQTAQLPWGLYAAGGEAISIVPALEPSALEADRYRSEIHPWISLQSLLQGPPGLLQGYPTDDVRKVRKAWNDARSAWFDRDSSGGPARFSQAMEQFTTAVRSLATTIEPDRLKLPIVERDRGLLAKTAYPTAVLTDAEVLYNRIDPFFWSGCASLVAACILGLSLVCLRKPLFWTGVVMMLVGVGCVVGGFVVRMYITRWAPVTSMFETVVWVTMCVSLLTLWLTFLPLLGPASKKAWGWTAFWRAGGAHAQQGGEPGATEPETSVAVRAVALATRLALLVGALYVGLAYMGVVGEGGEGGGYRPGAILPRADLGASTPNLSASLVWAASMFVAAMFVWYLPRIIPSAILAIPLSLRMTRRPEAAERMEKIYRLRAVALGGAVASFLAALAAHYAPFPRDIQALMPVLRSNFWLGIHVLTITTSYAGALTAWTIGNLMLGSFAFGTYRTIISRRSTSLGMLEEPTEMANSDSPDEAVSANAFEYGERRPPAFCGMLAAVNYRVLQVTVLLLAAGTILGGLWADVSWGRFWGWDPKEVGALIALLFILTALHGRRAGWHGDLSLAIGSIMGFAGVMWAWYIVNFILNAGLHSYGAGEGGQVLWLLVAAAIQLLFIGVAITRVVLETGRPAAA